jgi:hypothetical protein
LISRSLGSIASCYCGVRSASAKYVSCVAHRADVAAGVDNRLHEKWGVGLPHMLTFYSAGRGGNKG